MAVIAILISLLAPSLTGVRQAAHQVVCRSNVRQIGFGIFSYAESHADQIPRSEVSHPHLTPASEQPWDTVTLRFGLQRGGAIAGKWDGLGLLYDYEYLPTPKIFYCPAHSGKFKFAEMAPAWAGGQGEITGNFQYRARGPQRLPQQSGGMAGTTTVLPRIHPSAALVTDSLRSREDFSHEVGANVLRASLAVEWYPDTGGQLISLLPKDSEPLESGSFYQAWGQLDNPVR